MREEKYATFGINIVDSDLYLSFSDPMSCRLLDIPYPVTEPVKLSEILEPGVYSTLSSIAAKLDDHYGIFRSYYNYPLQNHQLPIYLSLIRLKHFDSIMILGYAQILDPTHSNSMLRLSDDIKNVFFQASFDNVFCMNLSDENTITLSSYNKLFTIYFEGSKIPVRCDRIDNLFPPSISNFLYESFQLALSQTSVLRRSLLYKYTENEISKYLCPHNKCINSLLSFFPVSQPDIKTVLCCAKDITSEAEAVRQRNDLLEEYDCLFYNTTNAAAVVVIKQGVSYIERINHTMQLFLNQHPNIDSGSIMEEEHFQTVYRTRKSLKCAVSLPFGDTHYHYNINLVPIVKNNIVEKIIITLVDTTEQVKYEMQQNIRLTKREKEIIGYVIQGEKNSFIAQKLYISVGTVKRTISNVYSKLGISSRVELINFFHQQNFHSTLTN